MSEAAIPDTYELLGTGVPVSFPSAGEVRGTVRVLRAVGDALELLDGSPEALSATVLWINEPVVTIVAPVMEHVAAILCSTGGPASHVAIVARELGLPCVMRCEVADESGLAGRAVAILADGSIHAQEASR